jgi:hypothetical protein
MYKAGTVAEFEELDIKGKIPAEVYQEALRIVSMLDEIFGPDREVEFDDGGFVFIAEDEEDLDYFAKNCVKLESPPLEYVEEILCDEEIYLNAFFLYSEYEYGMTLFLPISIAPEVLLKEYDASKSAR